MPHTQSKTPPQGDAYAIPSHPCSSDLITDMAEVGIRAAVNDSYHRGAQVMLGIDPETDQVISAVGAYQRG
jgi:hypothetical protein